MAVSPQWIKLGLVGRPHGLQGAFFVSAREDLIPKTYRELAIGPDPSAGKCAAILESKMHAQKPLVRLAGISDPEAVKRYNSAPLWVARENIPDSTNTTLRADFVGRQVVDCRGLLLGKIEHVYNAGASDIATIVSADARRLDFPLIADYVDENSLRGGHDEPLRAIVEAAVFAELWS